jgi:glycosyltransferase involved in cell wall biosynthesis
MACGTPLVATVVGVLPEVVRDGETGLLVPPGEPRALAEAIRRLLIDPELRQRLAREGRRHAEVHHAPERWLDAVQRVYDEAAAARGLI